MSFESLKDTVETQLNPRDFAAAFYDSAIAEPVKAVRQLAGRQEAAGAAPERPASDSLAAKAGNMAGFIVDFTILSKVTGGLMDGALGKSAEGVLGAGAKMFVAGGIQGGLLTPSSSNRGLLRGRLENAAVSGTTFAVMGSASKALESTEYFGANQLLKKVATSSIAGGVGGVVEAYGSTYFTDHRIAKPGEVLNRAEQYAIFGAGFGALDYGLTKAASPVKDAYYRTKWAVQDGTVEAKRMTYSVLNKYDMRHPLQRVGDAIYGSEPVEVPRAPLTADNNPITRFRQELPEYFRSIQAKEDSLADIDQKDYDRRREIYDQQKGIKTEFALKLLNLWHGTAEQPGIASYSNAELATPNFSADRVAEVRKALTLTAKAKYPNLSPLTQALADLAGVEVSGRDDTFGLASEMDIAKEKFFNYDERSLTGRMAMPAYHHYLNRGYSTPLSWMPFEATEQLPNLFHASVSNSLDSIFTERGMLSARELRLRGISQTTGESANEEFPRRAISMTRDFDTAWCYHRHSPAYLTGYPVVFGISADVIPRAFPAGITEPGEIVIDKLGLGNNLLTKLGLRTPDITHIFVPDSEIASVQRRLAARRITGVKVVGFNEMQTPAWKPAPAQIEDDRGW